MLQGKWQIAPTLPPLSLLCASAADDQCRGPRNLMSWPRSPTDSDALEAHACSEWVLPRQAEPNLEEESRNCHGTVTATVLATVTPTVPSCCLDRLRVKTALQPAASLSRVLAVRSTNGFAKMQPAVPAGSGGLSNRRLFNKQCPVPELSIDS